MKVVISVGYIMSLSKKKSRAIIVNDIEYRYQVSTTQIDDDWNYKLNLTIVCAEEHGGCLQVSGLLTRNYWLDCPDIKKGKDYYPIIKPSHVETVINISLNKGWIPNVSGPLFRLVLENDEIFK